MNERIEATVRGRVQMVMYRDFTTRTARRLGLVGEVKNHPDGTVRVVAEGPQKALEQFIKKLKRGSVLARVDTVEVEHVPARGTYDRFYIAYD